MEKMNKELKEQVIRHGEQINKLFCRIYKIEDKVMRVDYEITASCSNCLREQVLTIPIGQKRPAKYFCEHCKCEVEVETFNL